MRGSAFIAAAAAAALLVAGCDGGGLTASHTPEPKPARSIAGAAEGGIAGLRSRGVRHHDVYAGTREHDMSAEARRAVPRIYVPNSQSNTVDEIDPHTYRVVRHFATGALPQHVTPSYDMRTLWVDNDLGNTLTPIDPRTGKPGSPVPVDDPYNLYFTPDGRYAMVIAERLRRIDFRDAHTMRMHHSLPVDCFGVDHLDFTADGRFALASCEFAGKMIVVDVKAERVVRQVPLRSGGMPQDVKLAPNGRLFYVADMASGGLWKVDATSFERKGFLPTGRGAHGLYPSRDSRVLYVANRNEGSISVVSFKTGRVEKKWMLSGGGSPDMGGVSADGRVLWLTGRYNAEVYAIDTRDGHLIKRIPVGAGPHGLSVWPQPGRYSLGHTGVTR